MLKDRQLAKTELMGQLPGLQSEQKKQGQQIWRRAQVIQHPLLASQSRTVNSLPHPFPHQLLGFRVTFSENPSPCPRPELSSLGSLLFSILVSQGSHIGHLHGGPELLLIRADYYLTVDTGS